MTDYFNIDFEFYEVLNEFPVLKNSLKSLDFSVSEVKEGESVHDFFEKNSLSEEEIDLIVRRLNRDLTQFMKTGTLPPVKTPTIEEDSSNITSQEEE